MKIAHLILAHSKPLQLERLINRLKHEDADFYIHVDLKVDIKPFLFLQSEKVKIIRHRVKVTWAGYSLVQATVNAFEEILETKKNYDFINLLSGQDYPLKNTEDIHQFFSNNIGKGFVTVLFVENEWPEAISRLTKYHLTSYRFTGSYLVERLLNRILPIRKLPNNLIPVGRSQWFTITPTHVQYIVDYLKKYNNVVKFFKFTWGSDEVLFQTILFNSIHKKDIVNDNLRYLDWSEGKPSPKTLTIEDFQVLQDSGKLFARKFNEEVDVEILDKLDTL